MILCIVYLFFLLLIRLIYIDLVFFIVRHQIHMMLLYLIFIIFNRNINLCCSLIQVLYFFKNQIAVILDLHLIWHVVRILLDRWYRHGYALLVDIMFDVLRLNCGPAASRWQPTSIISTWYNGDMMAVLDHIFNDILNRANNLLFHLFFQL